MGGEKFPDCNLLKVLIFLLSEDRAFAIRLGKGFAAYGIHTEYFVMDYYVQEGGKALAELIKKRIPDGTDIVVVLSEESKNNWWPPFFFGLASCTDKPTVSFLAAGNELPAYLEYWPRLRDPSDVLEYLSARNQRSEAAERYWNSLPPEMRQKRRTAAFYNQLRRKLKKKYGV